MGNKEFDLTEKIHNEYYANKGDWVISERDVREFINKVKDRIVSNDIYTADEIFRIINELAGENFR